MNVATEEYKQKVWAFLNKMKPGQRYKVDDLAKTETKEQFIEAIKEWMGKFPYSGGLSFNSDYSEFYMTRLPF